MSHKAKKKSGKGHFYTKIDQLNALKAINEGSSILSASKAFNVPYSTLHSRVKGTYSVNVKRGPASILSCSEEKELVEWAIKMNKLGFPVTKEHLLDSVQYIVKKTKKITPFTNGRPSRHWYTAFMTRNPELSVKTCQNLTKARATVSEIGLRRWFAEVEKTLSINPADIGPERIFNLDESAFCLSPKNDRVLVRRGEKAVYNVCISDKECYTALIGGNAAGELVPTMIIYNYHRIPTLIAEHFPDDFVIGKSETGWMKSETFLSYIANHFYPWCVKNNLQFPIILYLDGHSSHVTKELSDFCFDHKIELVSLYPNATHIMQPMDVALFHPLKIAYREAVRAWRLDNNGAELSKYHFATVIRTALFSLDIKTIFKKGFARCGLYPFSADSINYDKLIKNDTEETNVQQQEQLIIAKDGKSNHENGITILESKIASHILEHFKSNYPNEWTGEIQYKELYNIWLMFKKNTINTDSTSDESGNYRSNITENCDISNIEDNPRLIEQIEIVMPLTNESNESQSTSSGLHSSTTVIEECSMDELDYDSVFIDSISSNNQSNIQIIAVEESQTNGITIISDDSYYSNKLGSTSHDVKVDSIVADDILEQVSVTNDVSIKKGIYLDKKNIVSSDQPLDLSFLSYTNISNKSILSDDLEYKDISLVRKDSIGEASSQDLLPSTNDCTDITPNLAVSTSGLFATTSTNTIHESVILPNYTESSVLKNNVDESFVQELLPSTHDCADTTPNLSVPSSGSFATTSTHILHESIKVSNCTENVADSTNCNPISVFGSSKISGYLYCPSKKERKEKKKINKPKFPYVSTSSEWRSFYALKQKKEEEEEQKKAERKAERELKHKIKHELENDLKRIQPKKMELQKQIKELQLNIQKCKVEKKLLELQLKTKEFEGSQIIIEEKIENLKLKIKSDSMLKTQLLKSKENFVREEKKIKQEKLIRKPLEPKNSY